jgi:hypothetical protein
MPQGLNYLIAQGGTPPPPIDILETEKNALAVRGMRRAEEMGPENVNWLREDRKMQAENFNMGKQDWLRQQEMRPITDSMSAFSYLEAIKPMLTPDNWDTSREHLVKVNKLNGNLFPSLRQLEEMAHKEGVTSSEEFTTWFEGWKTKSLETMKTSMEKKKLSVEASKAVKFGKPGETPTLGGTPIGPALPPGMQKASSEIGKYKEDRDRFAKELGEADPIVKALDKKIESLSKGKDESRPEILKLIDAYNETSDQDTGKFLMARINKLTETSGLQVRVNKDGSMELIQGPMKAGAAGGMQKPTQTQVEKELLTSTAALGRLVGIERQFKPEYQELGTRWSAMWAAGREKMGGKLQPQEEKSLGEYSEYRRRAINNLNLYIKDITGAALTIGEADRLMRGMPNPGSGIFDGDSPTEFQAKMKGLTGELRMAIARSNYIRKHGMTMDQLPLEQMAPIVNHRGREIENELKQKGMKGPDLSAGVRRKLAEEFGLVGD